MIMNKKLLITIFACSAALASCNLDKFPLDKMSPESFFSNEEELQAYSNNFYGFLPSSSLYRDDMDNITHGSVPGLMRDGRVVPRPEADGAGAISETSIPCLTIPPIAVTKP